MRRHCFRMILGLSLVALGSNTTLRGGTDQADDQILATLANHQYDMGNEGRNFLLNETRSHDFVLLGELHGDNEIPTLLKVLWPDMWTQGYRFIAAEVSPWVAHQLEFVPTGKGPKIQALWTKQEATEVHALGDSNTAVIWGCDMEEEQPQLLIRELARLNPGDPNLRRMVELTKDGYNRSMSPDLLDLAERSNGRADEVSNDVSVRENLLATLEIEKNRLRPETKMTAQDERERLMKKQFLEHFRRYSTPERHQRCCFVSGETICIEAMMPAASRRWAISLWSLPLRRARRHLMWEHLVLGVRHIVGNTWNADERQDELAFAILAEKAKYSATLFDLRPIRALLHRIPREKRSALQTNLIYWADSYDALICYKKVTPLDP